MRRFTHRIRHVLIGLVTVGTIVVTTGMGACDTRYPDDVEGVVVGKTGVEFIDGKDFESHNPSLLIESIDGTQTRVWLKQSPWDGYEVGEVYP